MNTFEDAGDIVVFTAMMVLPVLMGGLVVWFVRSPRVKGGLRRGLVLVGANLLVLAFLSSLALAVFEGYYRFWCDTTDSFGLTRITLRWAKRHFILNKSGFRDNVETYDLRLTPGRRRITFLGDSFTAGHGIDEVRDRFANRIRTSEPGWEVHVVAVNGADTGGELKRFQRMIEAHYQLDEVVLVYILNDIADITPDWDAIHARIYKDKPGYLVMHSFFLNTLYYRLKGRFDPDISDYYGFVRDAYNGPPWQEQKERLRKLQSLIESNGGHLLVVIFPFLNHLGSGYEFRAAHERLNAFWRENSIPCLDLLGLFESHKDLRLTVSSADAHPGREAHALAAAPIDAFIRANMKPGPPTPVSIPPPAAPPTSPPAME